MSIHSSAIVEAGAQLGVNVQVGPGAFIEKGAVIGDACVIGPGAIIYGHSTLGRACRVHAHAVIGDLPQDLSFNEQESFVRIGDECVLREYVTIHRGTKEGTSTVMGDKCFLMANSHLGHNVQMGNGVILANAVLLAGYVEVGERVFMGGASGVHQFVRIGRMAMIGGLGALTKDVPPFFTTRSAGLNALDGMNIVGMRRAGFSVEDRRAIRETYRLLYRSGLNVTQALEKICAQYPSGPVKEITDFIAASKRGICAHVAVAKGAEEED